MFLLSLVTAKSIEIEFPKGDEFEADKNITLKITLRDSNNNPLAGEVSIILEDPVRENKIEKIVPSKEVVSIYLGKGAAQGYWSITATHPDSEDTTAQFKIKINEKIKFELKEDLLTITNTGNTKYTKPFQIRIGEYLGEAQNFDLEIGEKESFILIAPKGIYNIAVIVEDDILFSKTDVSLKGNGLTGKAIGALPETASKRSPVTGGIRPKNYEETFFGYFRNSKFIYVFVLVVFGVMVLLAIERKYRQKAGK